MKTPQQNKKFIYTIFLPAVAVFQLFFSAGKAEPQEGETDQAIYTLYEQTVNKIQHQEFDEAFQLSHKMRKQFPEDPAGAFGLLLTYQAIRRNYRVKLYETQIDSLLDLSIDLSKNAIKKNKKDGKNHFYLGSAYASRSMFYLQRGKWMAAFKDGSQVLKNFKRSIAYDPEFYDSYYGLGLFKYWLGAKSKLIRALPFSRDSRREGIAQMKLTLEKGRFMKVDSMYGLSAVYYNEHKFEKALELLNDLYENYPDNPNLLYRRGRVYQELDRWAEANESFQELYKILKSTKYQSISYQIECLYQLAKCQYQKENYLETQRLCQEAVSLEEHCDFSKELDGPFETFSEIQKQLHKLNNEVEQDI